MNITDGIANQFILNRPNYNLYYFNCHHFGAHVVQFACPEGVNRLLEMLEDWLSPTVGTTLGFFHGLVDIGSSKS